MDRYLAGRCSPAEERQLHDWLDGMDAENYEWAKMSAAEKAVWKNSLYHRILKELTKKKNIFLLSGWRWAAAAAVVVILASTWFLRNGPETSTKEPSVAQESRDKFPGSDKAVLTLADGSTVDLNAHNQAVLHQGKVTLQNREGEIEYSGSQTAALFNTIRTPNGGQYRIVLADGTKVWLNAASSLRFPVAFGGGQRYVEATGEVYFEVAPDDSKPFRVAASAVEVEVLGTHFNINAYRDEASLKTTLLEGSIKLSSGKKEIVLKPGQQLQVHRSKEWQLHDAIDTGEVIGWKEGYFAFGTRTSLEIVMRQIARWYDMEIEYEGAIPEMQFGGKISRKQNISDVLRILEHSNVHCRIENNKIIVKS